MSDSGKGAAPPPSASEVEAFLSRMSDVSDAVSEFLSAPTDSDADRRRKREQREREAAIAAEKERVRRRYDTKYFTRYDKDAVIDKLLAETDGGPEQKATSAKKSVNTEDYSKFELLALETATKQKATGNAALGAKDYNGAWEAYSNAIGMNPPDEALLLALHNNRALAALKLGKWQEAVSDAGYVLQRERHNVKALLRRARSLLLMHRSRDAMADVSRVLVAEPKNIEGRELERMARQEQDELLWAEDAERSRPEEIDRLRKATKALVDGARAGVAVVTFRDQGSDDPTNQPCRRSSDDDLREALDKLSLLLCEVGALLTDIGGATVFRLDGGLDALDTISIAVAAELPPAAAATAGVVVAPSPTSHAAMLSSTVGSIFVASLLRVVARAFDSPAAVPFALDRGSNGPEAQLQVALFAAQDASPSRVITTTAALQVLSGLATDARLAGRVWAELSGPLRVLTWIDRWATEPRALEALRTVEHVLRHDDEQLRSAVVGGDRCARLHDAAMGALQHNTQAARDVGASLLVRLSVLSQWQQVYLGGEGSTDADRTRLFDGVAQKLAWTATASAESRENAAVQALFCEALLATAHNVCVASEHRRVVAETLVRHGAIEPLLALQQRAAETLIPNKNTSSSDSSAASGTYEALNVAARSLGILGKCVLMNPAVEQACVQHVAAFTRWLRLKAKARATVAERDYSSQCVEYAALLLASLLTQGTQKAAVAEHAIGHLATFVAVLREGSPRAAGNAAMALSHLPALIAHAPDEAAKIDGFGKTYLDRIVALRAELHELESNGRGGTPEWAACRGAKKNLAVSLSKYCKQPAILQCVRDSKGMEILYTAM